METLRQCFQELLNEENGCEVEELDKVEGPVRQIVR